jgi:hypothetical protein
MIPIRSIAPFVAVGFFAACLLANAADEDESPRDIIEAAIKAHGGADNLKKTLCGNVHAKAKLAIAPGVDGTIEWEENYEVPGRYRRKMVGDVGGMPIRMEFALIDGSGWLRRNGEVSDFKGDKSLGSKSWAAVLLNLSNCLDDGVKLRPGGTEMVDGHAAKKVVASGEAAQGKATLFLDEKTHRLVKLMRRSPHPVTRQEADAWFLLGDFKTVDGIVYPHRLEIVMDGKKVIDLEITRIDFPKTLDDKLFAKPD